MSTQRETFHDNGKRFKLCVVRDVLTSLRDSGDNLQVGPTKEVIVGIKTQ